MWNKYPPPPNQERMSSGLVFTGNDDGVYVSGVTFHYKDELKRLGAKWNPEKKLWWFSGAQSVETVRSSFEELLKEVVENIKKRKIQIRAEEKAKKLWDASPEGKKARVLEALRTDRSKYSWICCEESEVIDWNKMVCSCDTHGFRVRSHAWNGT